MARTHKIPAERASQIDRSVLTLREMILKGRFSPGERIAELPLAERLEVSRTPLRLALDRLCHEGLLEARLRGGFVVREFSLSDVWDAIEIRGVLEGTAARMAAERLNGSGELIALRRYNARLEDLDPVTAEDFSRYLETNDAFHEELRRLSKSPILNQTIERICTLPFAAPGALVFDEQEPQRSHATALMALEHHRIILEAVAAREGTRAEAITREHSRIARKNLEEALRDRELRHNVPGGSLIKLPAPGG